MTISELFNLKDESSKIYKPVDPQNVFITTDEQIEINQAFLRKKIAAINSENYRLAVVSEPVYRKPNYIEVYDSMIDELINRLSWDIDQYNDLPLKKIACYFAGDSDFEMMEDNYSLKKGLLLFGPVGCGKTSVLKLMQKNSFNPFRFVSARKIADEYQEFGSSSIANYSNVQAVAKRDWFGHESVALCIDDLGTENIKKNFGNEVNVLSEIILNRYDYIESKSKTFITTNLTPAQLKEYYGDRAVSRMKELFNIIEFPFDGPDRRK